MHAYRVAYILLWCEFHTGKGAPRAYTRRNMDLEIYLEEIIDSREAEMDFLESINNETDQTEEMQTA